MPPYATAGSDAGGSAKARLTDVLWTPGIALGLVAMMFGMTVVAASLAAVARGFELEGTAYTYFLGLVLATAYLAVLGVVWLVAIVNRVTFAAAVGLRRASAGALLGGAVLATVVGRLAAGAWGAALAYFDVSFPVQELDPSNLFPAGPAGVVMTFLIAVVLAPLAEEVVFRGVLLSAFDLRWGATAGIVVSSALFAAMHVTPFAIPPIFVLSLVLGWLFERTRSLTVCVVAHAVFNGSGLVLLYALRSAGLL